MKNVLYRVSKGDTLFSVCNKFSAPVFSVINENFLTNEISEGDLLCIREEKNLYTVDALEDFLCVSKKLGIAEEELRRLNPIPYLFYGLTIRIR